MGMKTLYDWMEERELIRQRRLAGKSRPWTTDPVLQTYSFTNVMREYDRVSIWIQRNITDAFHGMPALWIMLCIARQINWPLALAEIVGQNGWPYAKLTEWHVNEMRRRLDAYQATGAKVYTGAYMIHADSDPRTSDLWVNKNHYVLGQVIGQLIDKVPLTFLFPERTMEGFVKWLSQFESWGGFMSYEVACDLRWCPAGLPCSLADATDIYTWANPGPGAMRGLNRIAGRPLKQKLRMDDALREMRELLAGADQHDWACEWPRRFEMRDIEHSLCEFDKYLRASLGEGKPRSQYHPKAGS